jgi:hypothetical protein
MRKTAPRKAPLLFARPPRMTIASRKMDSFNENVEGSIKVMYEAKSEPPIAAMPALMTKMRSLKNS